MINVIMRSLCSIMALLLFTSGLWAGNIDYHPPLKLTNSAYRFTESSITTQPGETVQICVDKQAGVSDPYSINISAIGNTAPHLSNFNGQALYFPSGIYHACFDLVIGDNDTEVSYELGILGTESKIEVTVRETSRKPSCGSIMDTEQLRAVISDSRLSFDDRFGNRYTYDDLKTSSINGFGNCQAGYFELIFGGQFTVDEMSTICQVFSDLSDEVASQAQIPILIEKASLGGGAIGAASPLYLVDYQGLDGCGLEPSLIWQLMNSTLDIDNLLQDPFIVGRIQITDQFTGSTNWHTLAEDPGPVESNEYDLYTTVLHESLHLLGFASRIDNDGSPLQGFYSIWDTHLYGVPTNSFLTIQEANEMCCQYRTFNSDDYNNLPGSIINSCSGVNTIRFGDASGPIVDSDYGSNADIYNTLSHLKYECDGSGTTEYVMYFEIDEGDSRRVISDDEKDILCTLGYSLPLYATTNQCSSSCLTIANDDYIEIAFDIDFGPPVVVEVLDNFILSNDINVNSFDLPDYLLDGCGYTDGLTITRPSNEFVRIIGMNIGEVYQICYEITGCENELSPTCDVGTLFIRLVPSTASLPACELPNNCEEDNLFCYGDFQAFEPFLFFGQTRYDQAIGIIDCNPLIPLGFNGNNSPDIYSFEGNLYSRMGVDYTQNGSELHESLVIPLSSPIQPGCTLTLEFEAADNILSGGATLAVFGAAVGPCEITSLPECPGTDLPGTYYCIADDISLVNQGSSFIWEPIGPITWTNVTSEPIYYLLVMPAAQPEDYDLFVDNIVVTNDCPNELEITSSYINACPGTVTTISYQICSSENSASTTSISVDVIVPDFFEVEIQPSSFVVANLAPGACETVHTDLTVPGFYPVGFEIPVSLDVLSTGTCNDNTSSPGVNTVVVLEECEEAFTCPCEGENALEIDASTGTSIYSFPELGITGNTLDLNNRCIAINGRLEIGNNPNATEPDLVILGGEFIMQDGAEIAIVDGAEVEIRGTADNISPTIYGCEQLWNGIQLEDGNLILTDHHIEDAEHAVQAFDNTSLEMRRNLLRDNFIGLYHFGNGFDLEAYADNIVEGANGLLPPFAAIEENPVLVQDRAYAGIYLALTNPITSNYQIGNDSSNEPNNFKNLAIGVAAVGFVDLTMNHNAFEDITAITTGGYSLAGAAIYLEGITGSSLTYDGSFANTETIRNCDVGIVTLNADVEIFNAEMDCKLTAIKVENAHSSVRIYDNDLSLPGGGTGVLLLQNDDANELLVDDNHITLLTQAENPAYNSGGKGIAVYEKLMRKGFDIASIRNNTIYVQTESILTPGVNESRGAAIYLNSVNNMDVSNNTNIRCRSESDIGILVQNSEDNLLLNNHISGKNGNRGTGILVEFTTSTIYSCNELSDLKTGMEFVAGEASSSTIAQNEFKPPMTDGLVYRNLLNINPQEHLENRWFGEEEEYSGDAALNEIENIFSIEDQRYFYDIFSPPSIGLPNAPGGLWFDQQTTPTALAPCSIENFPVPTDEEYKKRIANGSAIQGDYALSREWMSQRSLYRDLERTNNPVQWSNEIQLFHQSANQGQIGDFHEGRNELQKVNDHTDLNTWKNLWDEKREALSDLVTARNNYNNDPTTAHWVVYNDEKARLQFLNQDIAQEWANLRQEKVQQLSIVESLNNTLTTEIDPQLNEKIVNAILVKILLNEQSTLTNQDEQSLQQIGDQCPLTGGHAVYQARSLYQLIDRDYQFSNNCVPGSMLRATNGSEETATIGSRLGLETGKTVESFLVSPNPANDLLNITVPQAGQVQLLNALGTVVKTQKVTSEINNYTLQVNTLPAGLYYVRFQALDGSLQSKRIIITN